jgi:phosphoglycerate dehydrogenase-like enzyme
MLEYPSVLQPSHGTGIRENDFDSTTNTKSNEVTVKIGKVQVSKIKAAFFNQSASFHDGDMLDYVYGCGRRRIVAEMTDMYPVAISSDNFNEHAAKLADIEAIFSTWGIPEFDENMLDRMPNLKAVFYAAGSVKEFAPPLLKRNIIVCSAWAANGIAVAEFCLGQILLACKGYFRNTRDCRTPEGNNQVVAFHGNGVYGEKVAIIGAGQIGRRLIELLRPFQLKVLVVDPYLSEAEADDLKITKVTLEEAFRQAYVVSNHLPNLPELRQVLDGKLFASMRQDATFINTGRGAQVYEPELIDVLKKRPDLMALLDVTDPEPAPAGSELYELPNVQLSSHLAGAHNDEVVRMADTMIEEFERWRNGDPLRFSVSLKMLERMA